MDGTNFEEFIDLIRRETSDPIVNFCPNNGCEHISDCWVDTQFEPIQRDLFDFHSGSISNPNSGLNEVLQLPTDDGDYLKDGEEEENDNCEESSATTTTTTQSKKKGDRSRTLISERRRRGRMKDTLYALRALVPNITKMDKASIVGDAVLYVQDLQKKAKNLQYEIAGLESSLGGAESTTLGGGLLENRKTIQFINNQPTIFTNIIQMDMFQVEERGYYVRVECNRGEGVAPSLYMAIEALTRLDVQSSNLGTLDDRFILTFTLKAREGEVGMNLQNLELGITRAFLNQGFVFQTQLPFA